MKKRKIISLFSIAMTALLLPACKATGAEKEEVPFSGPVSTPLESESPAIQAAPAYDVEAARSYIQGMPRIRELVDTVIEREGLAFFGEATPSEEAVGKLEAEIEKLRQDDHKVSVILADLKTQSGFVFNANEPMCTQSTIKGIYIGSLLCERPEAMEENGQYMHDAIVYSANDPYHNLRAIYGTHPLLTWCEEVGVDQSFTELLYPRDKTARDMFRMWTRLYCFLNEEAAGSAFASWFADSSCSASKAQLGDRYPVQTKAGWENGLDEDDYDPEAQIPEKYRDGDPLNDECAINDTGVVYTEDGPYLFVIYTDHPFGVFNNYITPNPLLDLVEAMHDVQKSLGQ